MSTPGRRVSGVKQAALDLVAIAGFGVFLFGVHQIYAPAALILGGGVVAGGAAWMAKLLKEQGLK